MIFTSFYLLSIMLIDHSSSAMSLTVQPSRGVEFATKASQHELGATPESINVLWLRQAGGSSCDGNNEDSCTSSAEYFAQTSMPVMTQLPSSSTTEESFTAQGIGNPAETVQSQTNNPVTAAFSALTTPTSYTIATSHSTTKSSSILGTSVPGAAAQVTVMGANSFMGLLAVGNMILFWL